MRIDSQKLQKFLEKNPTEQNRMALAKLNGNEPSCSLVKSTNPNPSKGKSVAKKHSLSNEGTDDLPAWLQEIVYKNSDVLYCVATKSKAKCPHVAAFVGLAKNPSIYKGKQEHFLQVALFLKAKIELPEMYDLMFAVPNGGLRSNGVAGQMKAEGQKGGYPDIGVESGRGGFFGYRLEVKTEVGVIRDGQVEWSVRLNTQNYKTEVGYGFYECWGKLKKYWDLAPTVVLKNE
ncbi:hypothetical protein [Vibrio sp. D431a]|uniref:hypothetical protein n=1 Tax=Vibrio sp. D431a TaxID=2837388 RepID=UPI0025532297|nr:hypothetical protein [Vibrio sp. D431a]MDK9790696.1 hypothetical protein [Vibrio sp. D431a]